MDCVRIKICFVKGCVGGVDLPGFIQLGKKGGYKDGGVESEFIFFNCVEGKQRA